MFYRNFNIIIFINDNLLFLLFKQGNNKTPRLFHDLFKFSEFSMTFEDYVQKISFRVFYDCVVRIDPQMLRIIFVTLILIFSPEFDGLSRPELGL